ncbi:cytoskeleton protein RodZ [Gammaproteobacteria bacterium]
MNSQPSDISVDISLPAVELVAPAILSPSPTKGGAEGEGAEPGSRLQRAREERRWSRADIAAMLRLNVNVITALEENDYSRLPFPTFVRGYLRSYASLLNLAPEPFLAAYARQGIAPPPPSLLPFARRQSRGDRLWRFFTYIVVLGLIGLVGLWWQNRDAPNLGQAAVVPLTLPSGSPPIVSSPAVEIAKRNTQPLSKGSTPHEPSAPHDASAPELPSRELAEIRALGPPPEDDAPTPPASVLPPAGQHETTAFPAPSSSSPSTPAKADPALPLVQTAATGGTTVASTTTLPATDAASPSTATTAPSMEGQSTVIVEVTTSTWVKIKDSKGKVLFNTLIKAGQSQSFQGRAPLKVRLGKVKGVTVSYNGQPFDFSRYIKGETARFTLGKKH